MVMLTKSLVFAWETCCTSCGNQVICDGQVCGGLFQACGAVTGGPGNCEFQWSCQTSAWRIAVFVISLVIGIGAFLICIYTGFRWLSYRKFTTNYASRPVQQPTVVPINIAGSHYVYATKPVRGTFLEPSAPPPPPPPRVMST